MRQESTPSPGEPRSAESPPREGAPRPAPPPQSGSWEAAIDRAVDRSEDELISVRRHLHRHPDPSGQEQESTAFVRRALETDSGLEFRLGPDGRGLIVDLTAPPSRPIVGLRADLDALWIKDSKPVPYRSSRDGIMHACGHDGHTAALVGAVRALRSAEQDGALPWPVHWRAIFQPAEETCRGALEMISRGAIVGVQAIFALHMDPRRQVGRIGVKDGFLTASCDEMQIEIEGRGGHSARPHESIDPIVAAAQLISSIYLFVPRAIDSQDPVVVTIGKVEGGKNANVIPERVSLSGTLRTFGGVIRDRTQTHIQQLARGLAETSGTRISVRFQPGPGAVRNDPELSHIIRRAATPLVTQDGVETIERASMGGEDFSFYLDSIPGHMFRLGCGNETTRAALHSSWFDLDERSILLGAKILARAAVLWSEPGRARVRG